MADYLFVPQTVLDRWSEQGKVQVDDHVLTLLGEKENKVFALTTAVRFLRMEAGEDAVGLLQKVKTTDALKQMGAEHYLDSVILGDNAYEVQQGFLADANAIRRAAAAAKESSVGKVAHAATASSHGASVQAKSAEVKPGAAKSATKPGEPGEPELLSKFFLDNL